MNFRKILIANRGEIAVRVIRTARALGYHTVAVFSEVDALSPHVALADEAVALGGHTAAESYLSVEKVLDAARRSGAQAVHPGYGFLSERADFAQACVDAGLVFIGPPASAITAMGNKAVAKRRMRDAGVPCAPGYLGEAQSDETLRLEAQALGVPLLVKAVNGGGGRGMRLVRDMSALADALSSARREALSAFGDDTLMLERLIEGGRHIEVQVFADAHGNAIHMGERDCTAQRRRQKVIEEAPSPVVNAAMREQMGADAVAAALAVGYCGAGTVEFIVDADLNHYFLEMNTRLQVEHPVTECITGLDLVEWQLRVAAGEPLPLTQEQVQFEGHAIEVRLYAEDPYTNFTPQTGEVLHWRPKEAAGQGVRIDSGIVEGSVISPYYDPMVAKVIAHGRDRSDAIRRLMGALESAPLVGLRHNGRFLRDLLDHTAFRTAAMNTGLLDEWVTQGEPLLQAPEIPGALWQLAAAVFTQREGIGHRAQSVAAWNLSLHADQQRRQIRVHLQPDGVEVTQDGESSRVTILERVGHQLHYEQDGVRRRAVCVLHGATLYLVDDAMVYRFDETSAYPQDDEAVDPSRVCAPVAGTVAAISVAVGDTVSISQPLVCVEAMKMEMWQSAQVAGRVREVHVSLRTPVEAGVLLIEIEPDETAPSTTE